MADRLTPIEPASAVHALCDRLANETPASAYHVVAQLLPFRHTCTPHDGRRLANALRAGWLGKGTNVHRPHRPGP